MYKYMYQADTKAAKWYYKNKIYYLAYGSGYISKKKLYGNILMVFIIW